MRKIGLAVSLTLLFAFVAAWAEAPAEQAEQAANTASIPAAPQLLERMTEAKPVTYQGVQVFQHLVGERVLSRKIRIFRQLPDKLRVESGEDFKRVLVMAGKHYWRTMPERARTRAPARLPRFSRNLDVPKLLQNYEVTVSGSPSLAGREAYLISIVGKYPGRPSLKLWLDKENLFRLKVERKDWANRLVFTSVFEQVSFPAKLPEELFQPLEKVEVKTVERWHEAPPSFKSIQEASAAVDFSPALPTVVPRGFSLSNIQVIRGRRRPTKALQLAYGDGLSNISVFERSPRLRTRTTAGGDHPSARSSESRRWRSRERRLETVTKHGIKLRVGSRGRLSYVTNKLPGVEVTVMGEIDKQELIEMAASLQVVEEGQASSATKTLP